MILHDIREAVRRLRGGELVVLRGRVLGLRVEITLRPPEPAVLFDPLCVCGHHASDHHWGHFECLECACEASRWAR